MQLLAQDEKGEPTLASVATKGKNYTCPECHNPVRRRKGPSRRPHFFHLANHPSCRQHQKSWIHLQLQLHLFKLLPEGEGLIEKPYPTIQRIADIAWEKEGIVFEIQCSPISLIECIERNEDYLSLGLRAVWILHDHRFNRRYLSASESYLRKNLCFFSHISKGACHIYDQFEIIRNSQRLYRSKPLTVDLSRPVRQGQHLSFFGALPHRIEQHPSLSSHIQSKIDLFTPPSLSLFSKAAKHYTSILHYFLEIFAKHP